MVRILFYVAREPVVFHGFPRKLTTQTSVINGVAQAESINVDRVCDADVSLTMDSGDGVQEAICSRR